MAKRVTKKTYRDITLEVAQEASLQFATAKNSLAALEAQMNEEINEVKERYKDEVTELSKQLKEPQEILEAFAKEQKANWGKKKSFKLLHCVIGFRTGTPKVTKKKGFSWEAVLKLMKKNTIFSKFIRTTEEINKEAILAEKDEKLLYKLEDLCFVNIDQDENFFVEPKVEELEPA